MEGGAALDLALAAASPHEPLEGLRAVIALRRELDQLEARHVDAALGEGRSWSQVAEALGVSKQAAHKRHAERSRAAVAAGPQAPSQRRLLVTGQARRVVERAREEAGALGADEAGPEHLLLGLLRDDHGTALRALDAVGVDLGAARAALGAEADAGTSTGKRAGVSAAARAALEDSLREAVRLHDSHLGVEHLLLALMEDPEGPASRLVARLDVTPAELTRRVHDLIGEPG